VSWTFYNAQGQEKRATSALLPNEYAIQGNGGAAASAPQNTWTRLALGALNNQSPASADCLRFNADGTVTILQSGWFSLWGLVGPTGAMAAAQGTQISWWTDATDTTPTPPVNTPIRCEYAMTAGFPIWEVTGDIYLAAGTRVGIAAYNRDATARTYATTQWTVARIGAGPTGPTGAQGTRGGTWWTSGMTPTINNPADVPTPVVGDVFLYPDSGDTFSYNGTAWTYTGPMPVAGRPALVTALPTGTILEGTEIYFQAAAGVNWHLRYRAAGAPYPWEYIGGPPLRAAIDTDQTYAEGATYVDTATPGPQITLPLAGDYTYNYTAGLYIATQTAGGTPVAGLSLGGAQPVVPDIASNYTIAGGGINAGRSGLLTSQPISRVVKMMYGAGTAMGGTAHARMRDLQITPVRLG
jgi:hypothetical protein